MLLLVLDYQGNYRFRLVCNHQDTLSGSIIIIVNIIVIIIVGSRRVIYLDIIVGDCNNVEEVERLTHNCITQLPLFNMRFLSN